jgi:glutathione synthase/RimK-type ligase-like ATP-grasp enzyme
MIGIYCNDNDISINDVCKWFSYYSIDYQRSQDLLKLRKECDRFLIRKSVDMELNPHSGDVLTNGNFQQLNKLEVLQKASQLGIKVPKTFDSNSLQSLANQLNKHQNINKLIVKPRKEVTTTYIDGEKVVDYTTLLSIHEIDQIDFSIEDYIFQEYIEPFYEVRVFYLTGKFYSSALFRKENISSEIVDIRYDYANDNVMFEPITLPVDIEQKLADLINTLNLSHGCIDLVFDANRNDYIFLEINPMGQFKDLSDKCNYQIAKSIVELYL